MDILSLVKGLRNRSTPIGRLPGDVLEQIITTCASERDLRNASHVCRHWRETFTSSPRHWAEFQCKNVALTLQHLARSEPVLITVTADSRSDIQAVIALRSATDRFGSLTLRLRPLDLSQAFCELANPAPALEHLEISATPDSGAFRPPIPPTFLGGSTPALKSLHFKGVNTRLNFSKFPALNRLTLVTNAQIFDISELFRVFTSARQLEEVFVKFSGPTTPIPESQGVIQLLRMRKLSFSNKGGKFPKHLLSFLEMPSVEQVNLNISLPKEDTRTTRDFLPPRLRNFPHLLEADNLELDVADERCGVQFSGPGGVVSIHASRSGNPGQDSGFQSHWLDSLEPMSLTGVERLTLRNSHSTESSRQLPVLKLLRTMNGVRSLIAVQCDNNIIEALSLPKGGSILFPRLKSFTFQPLTTEPVMIFPRLTDMTWARGQAGFPLSKVSSDQFPTFPRSDVDSPQRHVSRVQHTTRASLHSNPPVKAPSRKIARVRILFVQGVFVGLTLLF